MGTFQYTTPKGRQIIANEKTPAYGFLICDFTPKSLMSEKLMIYQRVLIIKVILVLRKLQFLY